MTTVQGDLANVDVASPKVYAEGVPHEALAALRKHDPVHWHPWPGTRDGFWLLSKHADLLDKAIAQGEFDWVTEISEPVPITVLISILGLPQEDAPMLIELTSEMAAATDPEYRPDPDKYPTDVDPRLLPFGTPAAHHVFEYGRKIGEQRRKHPTDDL